MPLPFSPSYGPFRWRLPKHDTNAAEPESGFQYVASFAEENEEEGK